MIRRAILIGVVAIVCMHGLFAQGNQLKSAQQLTISEGLAHNGVTSIIEDSRGYIWIGTYDGLNRYDGYAFTIFKNTVDKDILLSNRVRAINEDQNGDLWIGTDEGISKYDYSRQSFQNIYSNKLLKKAMTGPIIRKILTEGDDGTILCATEGEGLLLFNSDGAFSHQSIPNKVSDERVHFFDGKRLDQDYYVFSTSIGLLLYHLPSSSFKKVLGNEISSSTALLEVKKGTILVALNNGLAAINYSTAQNGSVFTLNARLLEAYTFNGLSIDKLGNLWLSMLNNGLLHLENVEALLNEGTARRSSFMEGPGRLRASCVYTTSRYGCWFGSFDKGLFRFTLKENPFRHFKMEKDMKYALASNNITRFSKWDDKRVYISASRGGFGLFNTEEKQFEPLPFDIPESLRLRTGFVFVDSRKDLWLRVVASGLYRIRKGSTKMEKIGGDSYPNIDHTVSRTIIEDGLGNIWVGGVSNVIKISLDATANVTNIESLNQNPYFQANPISLVRTIFYDSLLGFTWIGTDADGLFRMKNKADRPLKDWDVEQFVKDKNDPLSISSNFVTNIVRLPNQELWLGTEGGGICKVLNADKTPGFESFSEKQGLSNNVVKSIVVDGTDLWVSTNKGLNKFETDNSRFTRFHKADGLLYEDFFYSSEYLENGYILMSSEEGFCYFKPKDLPDEEPLPNLVMSDFSLYNKIILPEDSVAGRVLLGQNLSLTESIELRHDENVFSIQLTSLHYSNPENRYLKYQLWPLNKEWVEVPSSQRSIYYSGLQPGDYELRAMASNSLNQWTGQQTLKISIAPPFWKTKLAYFIYVVLIGLLIYVVMYFILKIQSLRHNIEIEQLEKDTEKKISAAKLRFFSNISHEIKTPLTLISGPIAFLVERFKSNTDVQEKLQLVQRQSKKISQLVDQVHDFQRADANKLKLNPSHFCFDHFIEELIADFDFIARNDQKKLELKGSTEKIYVSADKDKLEKIFNNLLSNAFKFTQANDSITVGYRRENKDLIVVVKDTGRGIDGEDLPLIFERFYQSNKKHSSYTGGSGIGLAFSKRLVEMHYGYIGAQSEVGKGTSIEVRLPVIRTWSTNNQAEKEQEILLMEKEMVDVQPTREEINIAYIKVDGAYAESKIFFAEDNTDMRKFVSGVLSNFFRVETFANGAECLRAMEEEWPDLVLSDVLMPELNGFELCKCVKSDIKTSHIPVVLLTACTATDDHIQGLNEGADAYIKKPFEVQHLVSKIESLLRIRQQLKARFQIDLPLTLENDQNNGNDHAFLEKLYSLMAENLDNQELDLNSFARELYLNRTHFYQKVKALTDQTPFELLKMYRLKKAAEFLVQKQVSVKEVYMMTGFKSRTHFAKLFKEKYGATPGKYAEEMEKKYSEETAP
ncbi:MAG: ATP-binding protein [Cyclobacteriaceae bacterium]